MVIVRRTVKGRKTVLILGGSILALLGVAVIESWPEIRREWFLVSRFERLKRNAQGCLEYRHRRTGITFVLLPGGSFAMGSPEDEAGRRPEEVRHEVTVRPFLLAKREVSQEEWRSAMGKNPSFFPADSNPVEMVSWNDCRAFCAATGLGLPAEAQWEYACRAGSAGAFAGTGDPDAMGWCSANSGGTTHPVGQKEPNGFGLHDLHGNVWEWCRDVYDPDFYSKPEASAPDPACGSGSADRVLRGGSWFQAAEACRSARRHRFFPSSGNQDVGFRPACNF